MAKQGMKRPETDFMKPPKNDIAPVQEIQGKAKHTKKNTKIMPYNNQSK
ncbi:MAG: hypothetical protein FWE60_05650 [Oscillospiraceae bacterium]|jgi:hypothetical protein|nr:hypothetical protein [Oscillospiraceae bacterium]